jgi:Skp family chaperone for outer membrane proteins
MRRFSAFAIALAAAAVLGAAPGWCAQEPQAAAGISAKIGYVDFTKALNAVSDGVSARERLRTEFKERQGQLDNLQSDLTRMKDEIERNRLVLSSEELAEKEKAYRQKFMDVQRRFADFKREMANREDQLTEDILKRLRSIVKDIGDSEGYALILEKSQEVVLYAPSARDLTDRVISEYNRGRSKGRR